MAGMVTGLILMIGVKQWTHIAFTWYVLIGTTATFTDRLLRLTDPARVPE